MPLKTVKPRTARELAFAVLEDHRETGEFVSALLDERLRSGEFPSADRRLATEIATGVVRRRLTLQRHIEACTSRPRQRIEQGLWTLLEIGAYQLLCLDSVPPHAGVSETINVAKRFGPPRWTGFLNASLRALAREPTDEETGSPAADSVPLTRGRYRRLVRPLFPDPVKSSAEYFSIAFSFPRWLAERWLPRFEADELFRLGFWFNEPHPPTLRVNRLKADRDDVLVSLAGCAIAATAGETPDSIHLERSAAVTDLPGFAEGQFTVQDESAMRAAELLDPQPGETVLDLCAAPGTKTTHLAERMQDSGRIVATDVNAGRLQRVAENVVRLGVTIVEPQLVSHDLHDAPAGPFDAALVDVPCSNTGVLGKRPEARWRIAPDDLRELPRLQTRLLHAACDRLRPGGRVVYSTCSIEPEENEGVVEELLEGRDDLRLERQVAMLPGRPSDGGFLALLTRS